MRKVLIVSYYYPPRPGVGANRIGGLTKYLRRFGWEAVVLTPEMKEGSWAPYARVVGTKFCSSVDRIKRFFGFKAGEGLQQQLGIRHGGSRGVFTRVMNLFKEVAAYPDEFRNWVREATRTGLKLVDAGNISAVVSSSSPVSTHLIARNISEAKKIPWIADYRDLWTQSHYYEHTRLRRVFEERLEIKTLEYAAAVVTVSEPCAEKLRLMHKKQEVFCITNGFDPEETWKEAGWDREVGPGGETGQDGEGGPAGEAGPGGEAEPDGEPVPFGEKFTITYTGSLYDLKRNPALLLEAMRELIDSGYMDGGRVRLDFYGPYCHPLQKLIERFKLEKQAVQYGTVAREVSLERQRKSSVLLVVEWDCPGEEGVYTGKIFEYLSAQRPVLVLGGRGGVLKNLMDTTQAGFYVSTKAEIKEVVLRWYDEFIKKGRLVYEGKWKKISGYSHIHLAEKYAKLLDRVTEI